MSEVLIDIGNPLVQSAIVGVAGIAVMAFKRWRSGVALVAVAVAWAWFCATPAFSLMLWNGLAGQYSPRPIADYPHADAIVLVGGGPWPQHAGWWDAAADPALTTPVGLTLALYRAGKAPKIAISAGHGDTAFLARMLTRQGVPPGVLILTAKSRSTHEDATLLAPLLRAAQANSVLIVATGLHMPRTIAAFRKQGLDATATPASRPASAVPPWPHLLRPRRSALYVSAGSLHEYIGLFCYRLLGWAAW